jgi:hypothetical protein
MDHASTHTAATELICLKSVFNANIALDITNILLP